MQCPKCGYEPTLKETTESPDKCTACGVYFAKLQPRDTGAAQAFPAAPVVQPVKAVSAGAKIALALVAGLVIGYFAGREHMKYEIRSAFQDSFKGLAGIFSGKTDVPKSADRPAKPVSLPSPITVSLISKGFVKGEYGDDKITLDLLFENSTGADVRAFDGVLEFTDLLGNDILSSKIAINDPVSAGTKLSWQGTINFNQFIQRHKDFANAEQQNIKTSFRLTKVLFADGTIKTY
ncbi:hypothetical protein NK553_18415 [Pseudomonas sp. ZM23]|uniref:Zinc ribbon domain-containing protein n=1 Tax=Pseudomonas triclosanedens TaxID=2961893 RepID=A0ABY6ZR94_9PSED|nr:hypothetical protein [Pseudomonas triclosanedens]MCP8465929.1 hypothetical protein [Pseudomonas triclosanedens]MCP8472250.1 hypothetical protein [Pseudomonas triclosanedens]MCP8477228.1 hypothetical protein [Pseudomonas triclosanedens]WAI47434.1 hypothetical protein OU419_16800 [Pseudomonas triclosanedens]